MKHHLSKLAAVIACLATFTFGPVTAHAADRSDTLLVETESFDDHGGWVLDTQFIEIMGSPYMMAHGLGEPVKDATTTIQLPSAGKYRVFVRTMDWVARWKAPGQPGRFQLLIDGKPLPATFGTQGADWFWHDGGTVDIANTQVKLSLRDLTGFNGRADAIVFTKDMSFTPPNEGEILPGWRRSLLGLPPEPENAGKFDLVVIGGGYSGMGSAISAARMGLKVALVQNRPVLGGNGSSEIRVWAMGGTRRGDFPHLGEIVDEFADQASASPGPADEYGDAKKLAIVKAEPNIALFLNHHAYRVDTEGDSIKAVYAIETRSSREKRFEAPLFVDCTGHGTIGALAGADNTVRETEHLGMSNMWMWEETQQPQSFPQTPWALDLTMDDFPYPQRHHGQWFWESGFDKHPLHDLEYTRDWNLRAVFGAWNAMKNKDGAAEHRNAKLRWVAYVGGTRESRQLLGDVVLTREDIVQKRLFPDGLVPTTWDIDLHYPKEQYAKKFPGDEFISKAVFDKAVDRKHGYPVPYRCFYSRNVGNLFMAGRCVSVTHEALGTVRVQKTGGMMGEVVGKAAALCVQHGVKPRDIYSSHLEELKRLCQIPGPMRRDTLAGEFYMPENAPKLPPLLDLGIDPKSLPGVVIDDTKAKYTGNWGSGEGLKPFIGDHYRYHPAGGKGEARIELTINKSGRYEIRLAHQPHENRSTKTPVTIISADGEKTVRVNQRVKAPLEHGMVSLGVHRFEAGKPAAIIMRNDGVDGYVHLDAVQLLPQP